MSVKMALNNSTYNLAGCKKICLYVGYQPHFVNMELNYLINVVYNLKLSVTTCTKINNIKIKINKIKIKSYF